ncbi:hypothetical protein B0H16DRAFT_1726476 [Mycena metata]|uniref:F-box domain-containing protein n=1 Tax=Mycena metata TaxID=1033252 RepID=A0AAD7IMP3_9AGAR|nr:hypothetical protein B0H16DRAFT_1726476 [Mycena metata]
MSFIPFDILMEIMPLIDLPDLTVIARANRDLSGCALDRLYEEISSRNMAAACQSISANHTLAQRVRSLEINRKDHARHLGSILPALRDALRCTSNLRILKLDVDGSHSWVLKSAIGVIKLHSFSCCAFTDEDLLSFLRDQTDLEDIRLSHSYIQRGPPAPWRFLRLKKFDGPMSWADTLIPGQPVSHVVVSHITNISPSLTSLGLVTVPICHLQVPLHGLHEIPFTTLKLLLPAIENLTLTMGTNMFVPLDTPVWLEDLLATLSTVRNCSILEYQPKDEWEGLESNTTHLVKTATRRAPAMWKFMLQYSSRLHQPSDLLPPITMDANKKLPLLPSDATNITTTGRMRPERKYGGEKPFAPTSSNESLQPPPRKNEPSASRTRKKSMGKRFMGKFKTLTGRGLDAEKITDVPSSPPVSVAAEAATSTAGPLYFCVDNDVEWDASSRTLTNREDPFGELLSEEQYKHGCNPGSLEEQPASLSRPSDATANQGAHVAAAARNRTHTVNGRL